MVIGMEQLDAFQDFLRKEEIAESTRCRYRSVIDQFVNWLNGREVSKEFLLEWRDSLDKSPSTVNVCVSAVNKLLVYLGLDIIHLHQVKKQSSIYYSEEKELTRTDYEQLVCTARAQGKQRLACVIETICALGLRVSELRFLTVEVLGQKRIIIRNKGKVRTILMNEGLSRKLRFYCTRNGIRSGAVFVTRSGKPLGRKQIWAEMKSLCAGAGVDTAKVFPHNLRHLFAVSYYRIYKNIARLADLLGHSSLNTTRIYLKTSGEEQRRELESLNLLVSSSRSTRGQP